MFKIVYSMKIGNKFKYQFDTDKQSKEGPLQLSYTISGVVALNTNQISPHLKYLSRQNNLDLWTITPRPSRFTPTAGTLPIWAHCAHYVPPRRFPPVGSAERQSRANNFNSNETLTLVTPVRRVLLHENPAERWVLSAIECFSIFSRWDISVERNEREPICWIDGFECKWRLIFGFSLLALQTATKTENETKKSRE